MENFKIFFGFYELFALSLTLLTIGIVNYYYRYYTRKNPLPAPFPLPFVGHLLDYLIYSDDICEYCHILQSKYGDIYEQWYGSNRVIFVSKPEYVDRLLAPSTKSKYLARIPNPEGLKELGIYGKGLLFNHDVNTWKFNRQFFVQAVTTSDFLKESVDSTQAVFNEMEEYWKFVAEYDTVTDFSEWSHNLTTDIIFQLITGKKTWSTASYFLTVSPGSGSMKFDEKGIGESSKLSETFQTYIMGLDLFTIFPGWARKYVPSFRVARKKTLEARDFVFEKLNNIIQERRKEIENTPKGEKLRYDMLTLLITANTERSIEDIKDYTEPLTDEEIRGIVGEAIAGGIDTSANVFSFAIYYLSHYPDVRNRLRQEIDDLFGQDQNRPITYDDMSRLIYCEALIKEVSRVMTTSPFIGRFNSEPDLIENVEWDAGTSYLIFAPGVHLNRDYWEEPEKFNVDRFIEVDKQKQKQAGKNHLLMFGGGLRQCPGRRLAMIELKCLLVLTFRNWDIELVDKNSPLKCEISIVRSAKDLKVKIKPRNNKKMDTQLS